MKLRTNGIPLCTFVSFVVKAIEASTPQRHEGAQRNKDEVTQNGSD